MNRENRTFGVIGLGNLGSQVATDLARFGNQVIGVDIDETRVSDHVDLIAEALIADARDDKALKEAGLGECDIALIALGGDLESSILTAVNLKLIGVETLWAKATSKTHHRILSRLGVDRVVHPEVEIGQHIAQVMHNPLVRDYVSLGNGFHVVNFRIPETLEGKTLAELDLTGRHELRCIGVMRGTDYVGRDGEDCTLESDDLLLLLGRRADLRSFAASL